MPVWAIVALCVVGGWLLLTVIGYFLGPQGNQQPVTKRDHSILKRRANYQTPRKRMMILDAHRLAKETVIAARGFRADGMGDNEALAAALRGMVAANPDGIAQNEYTREMYGLTLGVLVTRGVLNDLDQPMSSYGVPPDQVIREPELMLERAGVRDLDAWPPLDVTAPE